MHPRTLPDLISDAGIRLKRFTPGHNEHVICPKCEGGRTREVSLSVSIDQDASGATWICHRGSCGWQDGARIQTNSPMPPPRERVTQKPRPHEPAQTSNRPGWLYEFFSARNIGARTVDAFGCYAVTRRFEPLGERPTIVFPYVFRGEVVNRKYRPHPEKQPQQQERDALQTLFNIDRLGDAPGEIVWVEGEPDVMALFECGMPHAVSLKDGAPAKVSASENDKRFEALRTHADVLEKARRIVLAGDMDAPGLALREELARRLGRHRCFIVTWPEGCKDACDVLRAHGPDAVLDAIKNAEPYPIEGLQRIKPGTLLALRRQPPPSTMTTGARSTDAMLKLPTEGRLIVVTGFPGHGKTTWTKFVMVHTASNHSRRWAVFSPEMQPWEQFAAECAQVFAGRPFWPIPARGGHPAMAGMTDDEIADAEAWLADRIVMMVCDAEDQAPTLDWILERARAAVLRDGVTDLLIDPWNEIDHQRGDMSETDYIGRALQRLKAFGLRHGCNVWIIAHPAKPPPLKPGEKRVAPGPYDLSGSAHWANKTDLGLTIHSPIANAAEVNLWKPRFRRWGVRGAIGMLDFDDSTSRYSSPLRDLVDDDLSSQEGRFA
jgi:twinkle protein